MKKGFTLIEVLVVAVIVAILAAVAIPSYQNYIANAANAVAKNIAGTIASSASLADSEGAAYVDQTIAAAAGGTLAIGNNSVKIPEGITVDFNGSSVKVKGTNANASSQTANW